jgi:PIN domain-containing protein
MSTAKRSGLRAVFDTNVYISAFIYREGLPFRIWRHAVGGRFVLLTSPAIMREIAKVLRRFEWQEDEIVQHLKLVARSPKSSCLRVRSTPCPRTKRITAFWNVQLPARLTSWSLATSICGG